MIVLEPDLNREVIASILLSKSITNKISSVIVLKTLQQEMVL